MTTLPAPVVRVLQAAGAFTPADDLPPDLATALTLCRKRGWVAVPPFRADHPCYRPDRCRIGPPKSWDDTWQQLVLADPGEAALAEHGLAAELAAADPADGTASPGGQGGRRRRRAGDGRQLPGRVRAVPSVGRRRPEAEAPSQHGGPADFRQVSRRPEGEGWSLQVPRPAAAARAARPPALADRLERHVRNENGEWWYAPPAGTSPWQVQK